jgi:hypothetical protein
VVSFEEIGVPSVARGTPQLGSGPQALIFAMVVAVFTSADSWRVLEGHIRIIFRPHPRLSRSLQVTHCEVRVVGLVDTRSDRGNSGKIGGCTGTLVGSRAGSNDFAGQLVILRHNKSRHWKLALWTSRFVAVVLDIIRQEPIEVPELWPCVVSGSIRVVAVVARNMQRHDQPNLVLW